MKKLLLAFCVLFSLLGNAQTWTNYNSANTSTQLPHSKVNKIIQDVDGSMWFATDYGVSNFNGITWKNYFKTDGLIDNSVQNIFFDNKGNKWFQSGIGFSKFDGKKWMTYNKEILFGAIDKNGDLWFRGAEAVSKFDGNTWTTYDTTDGIINNSVYNMLIDKKGNKWFATLDGISKFNDTTWTSYTIADGLVSNYVSEMTEDLNGDIWVISPTGISKFDGNIWTTYDKNVDGFNNRYSDIAIDKEGNKWFTSYGGVLKFDDTTWTSYTTVDGLLSNVVYSMTIDKNDHKWFSTNEGSSIYDDVKWRNFFIKGTGILTNPFFDKEGNKWFFTTDSWSTNARVYKCNDSTCLRYNRKGGIPPDTNLVGTYITIINSVLIDRKGNKWFTASSGVIKYNDTTWSTRDNAPDSAWPGTNVRCQTIDLEGNHWFGADVGVFKFDGIKWALYTDASGTPLEYANRIATDLKGHVWVSLWYGEGIFKFDGTEWITYDKKYGHILGVDVLGNIWCTSSNGGILFKFNGTEWKSYEFSGKELYYYATDKEGNSWFGGNGLYKFDGTKFIDYSELKKHFQYSKVYSLAIDVMNNLWISTDHDLTKFDGINCTNYDDSSRLGNRNGSIAIDNKGNKWFANSSTVSIFSDGGAGSVVFDKIQKGYVFYDLNNNGKKDVNETNIAGKVVNVNNKFIVTQNNGIFYTSLTNGSYTFTYRPQAKWKLTTDSSITVTVTDAPIKDTLYFGVQAINKHEVEIKLTGTATRAGFQSKSWINYANRGTLAENGTVSYTLADEASLIQSFPVADSTIGKRLVWKYSNLIPYEQRQISIITQMPGVNSLGDTLVSISKIKSTFAENTDTLKQVLTGSYDPNDKLVAQGIGNKGYVLFGKELEYTVRFQNTGTDTAFNVNIRDTLDLNLDVASLQIVASSHPVKLDLRGQNEATFRFENILLPHQKRDDLGSNGFVKYTIRPKKGLAENTPVKNKAHIYFDFNPAIITNETENTYVSKLPVVVTGIYGFQSNKAAAIFPNPTKDEFTIVFPQSGTYEISLANIQGKSIKTWNEIEGQETTLSVEGLEPGMYLYTAQGRNGQKYMGKLVVGR